MIETSSTIEQQTSDSVINRTQQGIHRKIARTVGQAVDVGTDIIIDAGDITAHTTGKGIRGLIQWTRSLMSGLRGDSYSQSA